MTRSSSALAGYDLHNVGGLATFFTSGIVLVDLAIR